MDHFKVNSAMNSLEVGLKGLYMRNMTTSANIANVSVPNYKRQFVTFEDAMQEVQKKNSKGNLSLKVTHPAHIHNSVRSIAEVMPQQLQDSVSEIHSNGNNVDIDVEMVNLAKNGLKFRGVADLAKREFQGLKHVINGVQ